ncbi:MAG: DUF4380 domain-containing protein [Tepidisphaeraceae bacterium]
MASRAFHRTMRHCLLWLSCLLPASVLLAADARPSQYKGWKSLSLSNDLIEVQVVPDIGRVIQVRLGDFEYLWVNPQLAGKVPSPTGLAPDGGWLNYGGDKLWPAPQGWDNDRQWPGPPDAVLDGSPHKGRIVAEKDSGLSTVELTSRPDPRTGIQFERQIHVRDGIAGVSFDSKMTNIDSKPRRWSIWQVTQLNATNRSGAGFNPEMRCYSPANPGSIFPRGYLEMFGLINNPSFKLDRGAGLVTGHYQRLVGKIGIDNSAGWIATVDGTAGYVFVERFDYQPGKKYPDDTSAQFWMNGAGQIVCGSKIVDCKDDPVETPHLIENEVLGPLTELKPAESCSFHLDWHLAKIGGAYPILDCSPLGVACEPFVARRTDGKLHLSGRFGAFLPGKLSIALLDSSGKQIAAAPSDLTVSPTSPLVLSLDVNAPLETNTVSLLLVNTRGGTPGELARTIVRK